MNMRAWIAGIALLWGVAAGAQDSLPKTDFRPLDTKIQALKKDLLKLNGDIRQLERDVLRPVDAQLAVFVSLDVGRYITPGAVQLRLDGKEVANYLYSSREIDALAQGGVHRVYQGNIRSGKHELVAFIFGKDSRGRERKLAATAGFTKTAKQKFIEIKIVDVESTRQPEVLARVWD